MNNLVLLAIAVGAFIVFIEIYGSRIKGALGEDFVSVLLSRLDNKQYSIIEDVMLPSNGNLKTTQIDHIVVSNFGIFLIETKAYKGWIFGSENQKYWTQVNFRRKDRFYSPLFQNYAHIKAIETIVRPAFQKVPILGLVVFPYADRIKVSGTDSVLSGDELLARIQEYGSPIISDEEREQIVSIIGGANITDRVARKQHIANVRNLKYSAE